MCVVGHGKHGERNVVRQLQDYLNMANGHRFHFHPPVVHVAFYNTTTESMAQALEQLGVCVWGHRVPAPFITLFQSNEVSDLGDEEGCTLAQYGDQSTLRCVSNSTEIDTKSEFHRKFDFSTGQSFNRRSEDFEPNDFSNSKSIFCIRLSEYTGMKICEDSSWVESFSHLAHTHNEGDRFSGTHMQPNNIASYPIRAEVMCFHDNEVSYVDNAENSISTGSHSMFAQPLISLDDSKSSFLTFRTCAGFDKELSTGIYGNDGKLSEAYNDAVLLNHTRTLLGDNFSYFRVESDEHKKSGPTMQLMSKAIGYFLDRQHCFLRLCANAPNLDHFACERFDCGSKGSRMLVKTMVNLDVTTLIALVSSLCNGDCNLHFQDRVLDQQATQERRHPCCLDLIAYLQGDTEVFALHYSSLVTAVFCSNSLHYGLILVIL